MKKALILSFAATIAAAAMLSACGSAPVAVRPDNGNTNAANTTVKRAEDRTSVMSHSTEPTAGGPTAANTNGAPASSGNSPMARAIDVTAMTAAIDKAKAAYDKNSKDAKAKQELADAYFERALALNGAAQYRAALGDFRKGLKLDATNAEAKEMHDRIISIFESLGRPVPQEGEEPAPMPYAGGK